MIFGNVAALMHALDKAGARLRRSTEAIGEFCTFHRMPRRIRSRLESYVDLKHRVDSGMAQQTLLETLPRSAQQTLLEQLYGPIIRRMPIFSGWCATALVSVILALPTSGRRRLHAAHCRTAAAVSFSAPSWCDSSTLCSL